MYIYIYIHITRTIHYLRSDFWILKITQVFFVNSCLFSLNSYSVAKWILRRFQFMHTLRVFAYQSLVLSLLTCVCHVAKFAITEPMSQRLDSCSPTGLPT